jgi:hypothetical protein
MSRPKPDLKKIAAADDKIAAAAGEMIKGPLWMIEQILRKHEQGVMAVMFEQQAEIRRLEDEASHIRALLAECAPLIYSAAEAEHLLDGFRPQRRPLDDLAGRVRDAVGGKVGAGGTAL